MHTTMFLIVLLLGYLAAVQLTAAYPYELEELTNGDQLMEPMAFEPTNRDQLMDPTYGDQDIGMQTELKPQGSVYNEGTTDGQNEIGEVEVVPCVVVPLYRYWSAGGCDHFYTTNAREIGTTTHGVRGNHGYVSEGTIGLIHSMKSLGTVPLHRYYQGSGQDHFYTTNADEIGTTTRGRSGKHGYVYEGVTGYCFPKQFRGTIPLYRYYKGVSGCRDHFYTTNPLEIGTIVPGVVGKYSYVYEGVACYISPKP